MVYRNLFVVICFFTIVILISQIWNIVRSLTTQFDSQKLSINELQHILNYRGVQYDGVLEKRELWQLVNATGNRISLTELRLAEEFSENEGYCFTGGTAVVIPNEELFNELVEDSKDSAWILMTILPKSSEEVSDADRKRLRQVWCYIQSVYSRFGVNMAILDCGQLYNLCWERGFHRSPFVLVLPRGRDRVKDSVDFFVYPYSIKPPFTPNTHSEPDQKQEHYQKYLQHSITNWLHQRLAHRVDMNFNKVNSLINHSTFSENSNKVNFISVYNSTNSNRLMKGNFPSTYFRNATLNKPTLAVSAHSFKFTGRIHFSIGLDNDLPSSIRQKINQLYPSRNSPSYFFITQDDDIVYHYGDLKGQTLNFESLQLFFRHLCPSTNDIFIWNLVLVNLMISFQAAFQNGSFALRLGYYLWYFLVFNILYCCVFLFVLSALSFSPLLARLNHYLLILWRRLALTRLVNHLRYLQLNQDIDLVLFLATWGLFVLIIGKFHKDGENSASNGNGNSGGGGSDDDENPDLVGDYTGHHNFPWDPTVGQQIAILSTLGSFNLTLQQQPPMYISRLLQWSFKVPKRLASKLAYGYNEPKITKPTPDELPKNHASLNNNNNNSSTNDTEFSRSTFVDTSTVPPQAVVAGPTDESEDLSSCGEISSSQDNTGSNNTSPREPLYRCNSELHQDNKVSSTKCSTSSLPSSSASSIVKWPVGYIFTDQCCICLQRYRRYEILCGLPCGHAFHDSCIKQWLIQWAKNDCPQCRWPAYKEKP